MLSVTAVDSLNNESDPKSFTIFIDATPPNLPTITAEDSTRNRKPTWSYSSTSSDVSEYGVIFNNNQEFFTTNTSFTPENELDNGKHTLKVKAKDELNNESGYVEKDVIVYCIPASYDIISVPSEFDGGAYTYASKGIMFVQFQANDKIGFKFDDFTTSAGVFVDVEINGVYWKSNIFFTSSSAVSTKCVCLSRKKRSLLLGKSIIRSIWSIFN